MPELRAALDRMDLKRVRLVQREPGQGEDWRGCFHVKGDGALEIVIGASLNPVNTLYHEVFHALRTMNLFTPEEWVALERAAMTGWIEKHYTAARYAAEKLEAWRRYYNEERPHGAIGNKVPIMLTKLGGVTSPSP